MFKRILLGLALILIILVGAILVLPGLVPTDTYREKLEAELSRSLARDVNITGEIKLSTFPTISVQTDGLSLANPEGFSSSTFMKVDGMSAKIRLLPLLSKQVEISGVEFDSPNITLEKRADGAVNWTLGDSEKTEATPKDTGPFQRDGRYTDYDPSLKLLRIKNGNISYTDAAAGQNHTVSNINIDLRAPGLSKPLKLDGEFKFDDLQTALSGEIQSPADFLNGKATSFDAKVETTEANIDIDGQFGASQDIVFKANFSADSEEPLTLAKRFHLPDDLKLPALAKASASGDIDFDGKANFPKIDAKATGDGFDVAYLGALDLRDGVSGQGKANAKLTDMSVITPYLKEPIEGLAAVTGFDLTGDVNLAKDSYAVSNITANMQGPNLTTTYNGDAKYGEDISATGKFDAAVENLPALLKQIGQDQPDAAALKRVKATGNIALEGKKIALTNLVADTSEGAATGQFTGNLNYDESLSLAGNFDAVIADLPSLLKQINRDRPEAAALKRISAKGNVALAGKKVTLTNLNAQTSEGRANGQYNGNVNYDESLNLNGSFDAAIADLPELLTLIGQTQPDAAALKRVTATGKVAMIDGKTTLTDFEAKAFEGLANGQFSGNLTYDDALSLNGQINTEIPDLAALDNALARELPYSDVAKQITVSSEITTISDTYRLSNLAAKLEGGNLNGSFDGSLAIGDTPDLSGNLAITATSLRAIAASQGIELPPNTDLGPIFENMNFAGQVSGTANQIKFKSGTIQLDKLSGNGDFTINLVETKPNLTGTLSLGEMDLRPYMSAWSAQRPTGQIMPWSTNRIDLSGLNAANASINITTPSVKTDRIELGQTNALLTLRNGTLTAKLNQTQLYEGTAKGAFSISNASGRPALTIQSNIKDVAAKSFLAATGGFDKVAGHADFNLSITGSGSSQADIMRNLNGDGTFTMLHGQLLGIDAESMISGFDQALTNRQLPAGIGLGNSTNFEDLNGTFTVRNGVATIARYQLTSGNLIMQGDGEIDLGNQTLDIGFRPKLQGGSNVAGIGVPLRFSGKFGQAKAGLDSGALTDLATARARDIAAKEIRDRIGGSLGGALGGFVGGNTQGSSQSPDIGGTLGGLLGGGSQGSTQSGTTSNSGLGGVVGGILGGRSSGTVQNPPSQTQAPTQAPEPEQTQEEKAEEELKKAFKGLFGKKK